MSTHTHTPATLTTIVHGQYWDTIRFLKQGNEESYSAFDTNCDAVIITANAEGAVKAGALLELSMYDIEASMEYMDLCIAHQVFPGVPCILASHVRPNFYYILMPLKDRFEDVPEGKYLKSCMECLNEAYMNGLFEEKGIYTLASTLVGCGRGAKNLNKREVLSTLIRTFCTWSDVYVDIHVPQQMCLTEKQVFQLEHPHRDPWAEQEEIERYARQLASEVMAAQDWAEREREQDWAEREMMDDMLEIG